MRAEAGEAAAELSRGVPGSRVKGDRHKKPPKAWDLKEPNVHRARRRPVSSPRLEGAQLARVHPTSSEGGDASPCGVSTKLQRAERRPLSLVCMFGQAPRQDQALV